MNAHEPISAAITDETTVKVALLNGDDDPTQSIPANAEEVWTGRLADFEAANEIVKQERVALRLDLATDGFCVGGGGAAPMYRVEVLS